MRALCSALGLFEGNVTDEEFGIGRDGYVVPVHPSNGMCQTKGLWKWSGRRGSACAPFEWYVPDEELGIGWDG